MMMRPAKAITTGLAKTFVIRERATRSEFWFFAVPWFISMSFLYIFGSRFFETGSQKLLMYVYFVVNVPVFTAAVRRLFDSGTMKSRASYVGWGLSGLLAGPVLYTFWNNIAQRDGLYWMVPVMIFSSVGGLITISFVLSAPSKSKSTLEVSK
ncbi:hypothetical protein [Aliiroseovarius sp. 2305UL8-7]|uniref:hypothetical protein n=1 Tax=Aliiroseovarius conchicola TaxID=3121637 RepID=UPI003527ED4A